MTPLSRQRRRVTRPQLRSARLLRREGDQRAVQRRVGKPDSENASRLTDGFIRTDACKSSSSARRTILHQEAGYIYANSHSIDFKPLEVWRRIIQLRQLRIPYKLQGHCARTPAPKRLYGVIVNVVLVEAFPPGVAIVIFAVTAPAGTVAVTCVSEFTVNTAFLLPNVTLLA